MRAVRRATLLGVQAVRVDNLSAFGGHKQLHREESLSLRCEHFACVVP